MRRHWTPKRVGGTAVVVLIVINALELGFFFAMRRAGDLYAVHKRFPFPPGYSLGGRYVAPVAAPCYLIRVSANGCEYCRVDAGLFTQMVRQARRARCETIVTSPTARIADSYAGSRIVQLGYVDMKLGRALNPFVTPQTILLDEAGRVVWHQAGAMDNRSLSEATKALGKLH